MKSVILSTKVRRNPEIIKGDSMKMVMFLHNFALQCILVNLLLGVHMREAHAYYASHQKAIPKPQPVSECHDPVNRLFQCTLQKTVPQVMQADLIIFSYNRPLQLYALLESLQEYVKGLQKITVLYRTDNDQYEQAYGIVQADFSTVRFVQQARQTEQASRDFKPLLLQILYSSESDFVMFATDDILVKDYVSIADCIAALQKTQAYGFYLRLGKNLTSTYMWNPTPYTPQSLPDLVEVDNDIYTWQFATAQYDWSYPTTVDMTLYAKKDVLPILRFLQYINPNTLEAGWDGSHSVSLRRKGLCFGTSKIVNLPLNRVQNSIENIHLGIAPEKLLMIFDAGYKIYRKPLHQWLNVAAHDEWDLEFVMR